MSTNQNLTGYGPRILAKQFDGDPKNYDIWEDSFLASLRIQNLHLALDKYADERPTDFNITKAKQTVYDLLTICLDRVSHGLIKREAKDDGVKALQTLRRHYLRETVHRTYSLWRSFINSKMGEHSATSYLAFLDETVAALKEVGETISDGLLVVCTLDGLTKKFSSFVDIANQRNPPYKYDELKIALLDYEDRHKNVEGTESIMFTKPSDNRGGTRPKENFKAQRTCYKCGHPGHFASECNRPTDKEHEMTSKPHYSRWCKFHNSKTHNTEDCRIMNSMRQTRPTNSINCAQDLGDDTYSFHLMHISEQQPMPTEDIHMRTSPNDDKVLGLELDKTEDLLLVDSGCTSHVEKEQPKFTEFNQNFRPQNHSIELADGRRQQGAVQGIGTVKDVIQDEDGNQRNILLKDALYIPSFKQDILSVWKTVQSGHTITFSPNGSKLTTSDGRNFNIIEKDKLFYLPKGKSTVDSINNVQTKYGKHSLEEWHKILGHCNVLDIQKLEAEVDGMHIIKKENFDCSTCVLGKMTQYRSRNPDERATRRLELVHCDIVGPIDPITQGGFRYGISFVDDYSGAIKVYVLKNKSDATDAMKKYLADTAPFGNITRLRCDNGTEFTCREFKSLLTDKGIKQEFSAPYSPHQNGTAERSHRSIFDMARCLLLEAQLPKSMWCYAVKTACYIRNRCYNPRTRKTPVELMTGKRPNLSKMGIFGTKCYAYLQEKKKLDPRSQEGVFVGYDDTSPAYLVYFPCNQTVKKVRCVRFTNNLFNITPDNGRSPQSTEGHPSQRKGSQSTSSEVTTSEENILLDTVPFQAPTKMTTHDAERTTTVLQEEEGGGTQTPSTSGVELFPREQEKRYPVRDRYRPKYLNDYIVNSDTDDADDRINNVTNMMFIHQCYRMSHISLPVTYEDAIRSPESTQWKNAMDEEITALKENDTYELTSLPKDRTVVGGKWVFQVKPGSNGQDKFKARYVAKGYSQVKNLDYGETFAPTAKMTTLRTMLNVSVEKNLLVHQMDVKTAFLNADIDHEIYVEQPEGYVEKDIHGNTLYCKLKKSLYGLKQSSRMWNSLIHKFFVSQSFEQSKSDPCLYFKIDGGDIMFVLIWVDDLIIASSNEQLMFRFKQALCDKFRMTDLGELKWFLGISFISSKDYIEMNQSRYIEKVLDRFNMTDCYIKKVPCDPSFINTSTVESTEICDVSLYREIVGSLIYLMTCTRPDLCFVVTKLSQYMSNPTKAHLRVAKQVLRYLKGTIHYSIRFCKTGDPPQLIGFCDSDWGSSEDRKSITGYCFKLYDHGPLISWKSKKQRTVALSSCEAEYMTLTYAIQEAKFLKQLVSEFSGINDLCVNVGVDNQSAINLARNPVSHQRSKHIDIRYHFIRDEVYKGTVNLFYVPSKQNVADMFTKPVTHNKFEQFKFIRG